MAKKVWIYSSHVSGWPCKSDHVHRDNIGYFILQSFAECGVELELLPLYLFLLNLSIRSRSPFIASWCLCYASWLSGLDSNCISSPTILQVALITLLCRLLVGLYNDQPPSGEGNFIFMWEVEATAPNLFSEDHPKSKLYAEDALTTMYLTVIVLAAFSSEKVVLSSTYPRTFTWAPTKPTKLPS